MTEYPNQYPELLQLLDNMKKLLFIPILLCFGFVSVFADQDPLYTQYITNPYLINPALTGTYPYYQIITNHRLQWLGFSEAPITNAISMYGPMVNQPMGLGGYIQQDKFGAESSLSLNATYAYNYGLSENIQISMGLMVGLRQYKIDGSDLRIAEYDNYFKDGEVYQQFTPDASVGVYIHSFNYNAGISVTNLFGNKLKTEQTGESEEDPDSQDRSVIGRLNQNFYIHGGYKFMFSREYSVEPTIFIRKVKGAPLQSDIIVRGWYSNRKWDNNSAWLGLAFRTGDAMSFMVGFLYNKQIEVGYSYDLPVTKSKLVQSGSHELMITFRFNNIK